MSSSLINWLLNYPKRLFFLVLIVTIFAGCFIYKNISINTSNTDLLSKELTFRKNQIEFKKDFPQFSNNIIIVVDAKKSDVAEDIATYLHNEIKKEDKILFNDIFYPEELSFFKKNGYLYLTEDELDKTLEQIISYQPFIFKLSQEPTLNGLLSTINLFLSAELSQDNLENVNNFLKKFFKENENSIAWREFFSDSPKKNYRKLIYIQPNLDNSKFFPSEESMSFIKQKIKNINNKHWDNYDIRLTGAIPMEQDELDTLNEDVKIGVIISLILVLLFVKVALKDFKLIIGSFLNLIIGLILTTFFALFFFKELNLISIAFAILFIGLGIDFSIHYCLRVFEYSKKEKNDKTSFLIKSSNSITKALFLTACATAIGFFSFAFTAYKGVAQLGIIAGTGMFISFFLTMTFLPCFLILMKNTDYGKEGLIYKKKIDDFYFHKFMSFFNSNSRIFFIAAIFFLIFSIFNLKNIEFDNDPLKLRNPKSVSITTINELISNNDINYNSIDILVEDFNKAQKLKNILLSYNEIKDVTYIKDLIPQKQKEKLETIEQFKIFFPIIEIKEPRKITSKNFEEEKNKILDLINDIKIINNEKYKNRIDINFINSLKKELINGKIKNYQDLKDLEEKYFYFLEKNLVKLNSSLQASLITEENIPEILKSRYIGKNGLIRLEVNPSENLKIKKNKEKFVTTVFNIAPNASGGALTTLEAGNAVVDAFKQAMLLSIVLTTLFLFLILRNYKKVLIVFLNLVSALVFTLSFTILFGLNLNFANIIALPLLFGLGAATSIQTIIRSEQFTTLDKYFKTTTPRAIIFSLLTTLATFFILSFSSHVGTASMGILLIISILSIFLANLTILLPINKLLFNK